MKLTPQQTLFKEYYLDPASETFGNARGSAIRAGFSEDYASKITAKRDGKALDWVSEIVRDFNRLRKAEERLDEVLNLPLDEPHYLKAVVDVSKMVSKGMAKHKYSERVEQDITSGGKPIPIINVQGNDSNAEDSQATQED